MTLIGSGFESLEFVQVFFGANQAGSVAVISDTSILCNAPGGIAGQSVTVSVVSGDVALSAPSPFVYDELPDVEIEISWAESDGSTSVGVLTIELNPMTPVTSMNFIDLVEQGLYDDTVFHAITELGEIEGGDFENGDGSGGYAAGYHGLGEISDPSTWRIPDETEGSLTHQSGAVVMSLSEGEDSAGSVFYIASLDSDHDQAEGVNSVFGQSIAGTLNGVEEGFDVLLHAIQNLSTDGAGSPLDPVQLVEARVIDGPVTPPSEGEAPTISIIDPPFGPPGGGNQIVVVGSGFAVDLNDPPLVTFDGAPAEGTIVLNDGVMFCNVPAGTPGVRVDMEVTTPVGSITKEDAFQYLIGPVTAMHISWTDIAAVEHGGQIAVELFEDDAPLHVDNFLQLTEEALYDHVPFHRIIDGFMIQGGDFQNGNGTGGHAAQFYGFGDPEDEDSWTVPDEADNGLTHLPGVLSMAKTSLPNSGGSQFFFVDRDSFPSHLDGVHTVFGRAAVGIKDGVEVSGLDMVDELSQVLTGSQDVPVLPVTIESAVRIGGQTSEPLFVSSGRLNDGPISSQLSLVSWDRVGLALALSESANKSRDSGTRGAIALQGEPGDRLFVLVRPLELHGEFDPPVIFGERSGLLSVVDEDWSEEADGYVLEVAIEREEVFVILLSSAPVQWVKAWVDPAVRRRK